MGTVRRMAAILLVATMALVLAPGAAAGRLAAPGVAIVPAALDFGEVQVGTIPYLPVTLTNTGDVPLSLGGWGSTGVPVFRDASRDTCPNRALPVGASCTHYVGFRVQRTGAHDAGTYQVYVNNGTNGAPVQTFTLPLRATGVVPPGVATLGQSRVYLDFGVRPTGVPGNPIAVTLTNLGGAALTIGSIGIGGADAADFAQTNTCGGALAPGGNCTVAVTFAPSATGVRRNATLVIQDSAAGNPHTAQLVGEGTVPEACFAETGFCANAQFFAYWQQHGGLAINGYPLSAPFFQTLEDGRLYLVQYFERVRMEYHPEIADPQFQILLGQFGRRILATVPNAPTSPATPKAGYTFFDETKHNVRPEFAAYWQANGGLAQFGYPLSEEFEQQLEDGKTYTVQYFERARFEWHPDNQAPYKVQLGQFGRRVLEETRR